MTKNNLDELKDGWGGDVLTSDRYVDTTTSEQSGESFCYDLDFDVFTDDGRYERWIDLYPDVDLRRCAGARGSFTFFREGDPTAFTRLQLPVGLGGLPVRRPDDPEEPDDDYTAVDVTAPIYEFRFSFPNVTGFIHKLSQTIPFNELFTDANGNPYTTDTYTIEYRATYQFGAAPIHAFTASVHPLNDVFFPNLNPSKPASNIHFWYQQELTELVVEGTSDHHPLERNNVSEYSGQATGPAGLIFGSLASRFGVRGYNSGRISIATAAKAFRYSIGGRVVGHASNVLHIGSNYFNATTGYKIADVLVTPEGGSTPSIIQLTVAVAA